MDKTENYDPVSVMAGKLAGDPAVTERVEKEIVSSWMVRTMLGHRLRLGKSQKDIAAFMGCSPSRISKLEGGNDNGLGWTDVVNYFAALGINISLMLDQESLPTASKIKQLVFSIDAQLQQLTELAKQVDDDPEICNKINQFYREVLFNFLCRFRDNYDKFTGMVHVPDLIGFKDARKADEREHQELVGQSAL